jgi:nucleoside-diphosphate-sugar epimerase
MEKILVIGACGQLGSELTVELRKVYGTENVIASDIKPPSDELLEGHFENIDVLNKSVLYGVIKKYEINEIYHLAAVLSAKAELKPLPSWELNMQSLLNILEIGREKLVNKIYWPSSIAVFGPTTPRKDTHQHTIMDPNTVYGISKLAGERWVEYYYQHFNVDVRSLRYPGLIGYKTPPGGGTTDYAVDIFFHAAENKPYDCFLQANTYLPMMYMDDAVNATIELMQADAHKINIRSSYNIGAFSVCPKDVTNSIHKFIPDFEVTYHPDFRQKIADSWPESIDDRQARKDWNWKHHFSLDNMTETMLKNLMQPAQLNDLS